MSNIKKFQASSFKIGSNQLKTKIDSFSDSLSDDGQEAPCSKSSDLLDKIGDTKVHAISVRIKVANLLQRLYYLQKPISPDGCKMKGELNESLIENELESINEVLNSTIDMIDHFEKNSIL